MRIAQAFIFTWLLTGCSQEVDKGAVAPQNALGNSSHNCGMSALSDNDMRTVALQGELGCSFTADNEAVLLVAMGVVASSAPAEGVIKRNNKLSFVSAPGGFDGMLRGTTFEGNGNVVHVTVTGEKTRVGESPHYPAELTLGETHRSAINGYWTCGP